MAASPNRVNPLRYVGVRALGVIGILVALELGLYHLGGYGRLVVMGRNRHLGWSMLPDQDAWGPGDAARIETNDLGYRGPDWERPPVGPDGEPRRDPELFRVAVLGNSHTFGGRVAYEDTWPRVLERLLAEELRRRGDPRRPEVMNFAVGGYVHEQMVRVYHRDVRPFRPDVLVFPLIPRDVTPMAPGVPDADYAFRDLILRTALHDFLNRHVTNEWIRPERPPGADEARKANRIQIRAKRDAFTPDLRPRWRTVAERTSSVLERVVADGGRFVGVALPTLRDVVEDDARLTELFWEPWRASRAPGLRERIELVELVGAFRARMPDLARELRGHPLLADGARDGEPPALPHADQSLFLWDAAGHYNPAGMRAVAEGVLGAIRDGLDSR